MSRNESNPNADDDWEAWGEARRCIGCGNTIPAERLEILPDTQQCTSCAASGRTSREDQREFCDRCGGVLTLTQRRGTGLAGYRMTCTHCGR